MLGGVELSLVEQHKVKDQLQIASTSTTEQTCLCTAEHALNSVFIQLLTLWNAGFVTWKEFFHSGVSILVVVQLLVILGVIMFGFEMPRTLHPKWWLLVACWSLLIILASTPRIVCGWTAIVTESVCSLVAAHEERLILLIAGENIIMSLGAFGWMFTRCECRRRVKRTVPESKELL